jgi:hypothetical protein
MTSRTELTCKTPRLWRRRCVRCGVRFVREPMWKTRIEPDWRPLDVGPIPPGALVIWQCRRCSVTRKDAMQYVESTRAQSNDEVKKAAEALSVRIEVLELQPQDVIVVNCPCALSARSYDRIKQELSRELPRGHRVLILESGMTLAVVRELALEKPSTEAKYGTSDNPCGS